MPDQNNEELRERLRHLEDRVQELEHQLDSRAGSPDPEEATDSSTGYSKKKEAARENIRSMADNLQSGEQWLNRIGIGLLLIGVAFLFKYSIDQGWLIPAVRSAIGLGIGLFLFISGLRMSGEMNPFRQILLGGGIAVFYITGFATYQLYSFLPGAIIWAFMIVVTLLALLLSLQQDAPILSVTGTLGALGTPFMLYSGSGSVLMLMAYVSLILAAGAIIYFRKGWVSLLWSLLVGGLGVLLVGVLSSSFNNEPLSSADEWMLQAGMLVWVLATWAAAVWRQTNVSIQRPPATVQLSIFWVPLWLLALMAMHWDFSADQAALLSLSLGAAGGAGYFYLDGKGYPILAFLHAFMGFIMATISITLFFEGTLLYAALAAEAVFVRYIAFRTADTKLNISAHLLFLFLFYWTLTELLYAPVSDGLFIDMDSLLQLAFIISGGILIPYWLRRTDLSLLYRICSHLMLLFWIYRIFSGLPNGQAWVTIVWGLYAIGLVITGFIKYGKMARLTGLITVLLVVGKLFLVDLSQLQALWRILLFIGLGGALMLLGYYLQSMINNSGLET
ncbi:MAG TPA: DUF2339 domain-containing protein [Fodinibius sp.]|nr:DUF2339 domain-containing protein [Fodinibius sp.]